MIRLILALALAAAASGCAALPSTVVAPISDARVSVGGAMSQLRAEADSSWSDGRVRVRAALVDSLAARVEVQNLTASTLQIVWDAASFVNPDGYATRIVPGETRVLDMTRSQPVTPIPANARVLLFAVSVASANEDPILAVHDMRTDGGRAAFCARMMGRAFSLVLPIEDAGDRREYTLRVIPTEVTMHNPVSGRTVSCPAP